MSTVSLESLMKKRYLYDGTEVQLTGRYAKKNHVRGDRILFEVTPTNYNDNWKKFVFMDDMYEIFHPLNKKVEFAQDLVDAVQRVKRSKDI